MRDATEEIREYIQTKFPNEKIVFVMKGDADFRTSWFTQNLNDLDFCYMIDTLKRGREIAFHKAEVDPQKALVVNKYEN